MQFEQLTSHSVQEPDPVTLCDRIAAALFTATTYILNSFALHAACLHPELSWPLIEELARKKAEKNAQPDGPPVNNVPQFRPRRRIG
jgi:hypothetical protein